MWIPDLRLAPQLEILVSHVRMRLAREVLPEPVDPDQLHRVIEVEADAGTTSRLRTSSISFARHTYFVPAISIDTAAGSGR